MTRPTPQPDPEAVLSQALRAMAGGRKDPQLRGGSGPRMTVVQVVLVAMIIGLVIGIAAGLATLLL